MSEAATAQDIPIQATLRVRESLWKRVKIAAIQRGCTVAEIAEHALEKELQEADVEPKRARKKGGEEKA